MKGSLFVNIKLENKTQGTLQLNFNPLSQIQIAGRDLPLQGEIRLRRKRCPQNECFRRPLLEHWLVAVNASYVFDDDGCCC